MNKKDPPPVITIPIDMTEEPRQRTCLCVWSVMQRCSVCYPNNEHLDFLQKLDGSKITIMETK